MTLPLLILIAVLSAFGSASPRDAGGGSPTAAATVDDAGGGSPTHG